MPENVFRGRRIELSTPVPIAPGDGSMFSVKLQKTADIIGAEIEPGGHIEQVLAGAAKIVVPDGKTINDVFTPIADVKSGVFVTLIVKNVSKDHKIIRGAIVVDNEVEMANSVARSNPAPTTNAANEIRTVKTQGSVGEPKSIEPKFTNTKVHSRGVSEKVKQGKTVHRIKGMPITEAMGNVVQSRDFSEDMDMVLPKEGERAVCLLLGHIHSLLNHFKFNAPIHTAFIPTIRRQLIEALNRADEAIGIGQNETVVCLTGTQIMQLVQWVSRGRAPFSPEEKQEFIIALENGIESVNKTQSPATAMVAT